MMLLAVLLFALVAMSHAEVNQLIVGGVPTRYGEHPYSCVLDSRAWWGGWSFICGCVIWNERYVVTAAHCVSTSGTYRIRVGIHKINEADYSEQMVNVARVIVNPGWNPNGAGYPHDIAMLELSSPLTFNSYVCGGNFADRREESWAGERCKLSGFGRLEGGGILANTQKKVNMEKILNSRCEQLWQPVSGAAIYDFHICFFEGSGVSACNGDSGGPVRCGNVITGITSWGISTCSGDFPSVYTRVSHYHDWLLSIAGPNVYNCN